MADAAVGAALGLGPPPLLFDLRESERDREREMGMGGEEKWGRRRSSALCLLPRCSPPSVPPGHPGPLHGSQSTRRSLGPARLRWTPFFLRMVLWTTGPHPSSRCAVGPARSSPPRFFLPVSRRLAAVEVARRRLSLPARL